MLVCCLPLEWKRNVKVEIVCLFLSWKSVKYKIITNAECVKASVKYRMLESRLFETSDNSNQKPQSTSLRRLEAFPRQLNTARFNKRQTYDIDLFCYCSMPECWDDMLQCELCEEWLHMTCEGLKTAPEGEWLCSVCRPPKSKRVRFC